MMTDFFVSTKNSFKPKVSVVISTYNRNQKYGDCPSLLQRSLNSILNQTFRDFELILIDDASSDSTKEYCTTLSEVEPRLRFYSFSENSGRPAKRYNFGISLAKTDYITFMFDDDEWEPTALETLYNAISKENLRCGMVYGLCKYINEATNEIIDECFGEKWSWSRIIHYNFLCNNSVIIRRSVFNIVGGYDEDPIFLRNCDWDLWWRIGRMFKVKRINNLIGTVYGFMPDGLGVKICEPDYDKNQKRQLDHNRLIPLKLGLKPPFFCRIRAFVFDRYLELIFLSKLNFLPRPLYYFLRNCKRYLIKKVKATGLLD